MDLSYVHGASSTPLIGLTIGQYFDAACERYRDQDAVVVRHQGIRLTYAELRRRVDDLACGLRRLGLEPGDRIGIWSQNNVEWVLTQLLRRVQFEGEEGGSISRPTRTIF